MTEALQRVVAFCFNELGIGKIYGECIEKNAASARVMEKAGLRLELTFPDVDEETGAACVALRYSLTREEWGICSVN